MMRHVHRDKTDTINLVAAAHQFVDKQENRKQLFGTFTSNDLPRELSLVSRATQTSQWNEIVGGVSVTAK